ncbi:hypothetical protein ACHAXA_011088 [Cyclostephanos tholiformis]|uniref:Essential protein Yae1 N-terminal domain-containing protein n=1 Tax=Cyclostephanos tholiformis TaxID=382380 RepID=A0ABD3SG22_9STRA
MNTQECNEFTMVFDSDDEFYGNQSSESDASTDGNRCRINDVTPPTHPFGQVATHEYRSSERAIKTLSYLDGYDETKEEKLQDGFSHGYRRSFNDAFRIGRHLGSLCAKAAIGESSTLGNTSTERSGYSGHETKSLTKGPATLVMNFLRNEILDGKIEDSKKHDEALLKLEDELSRKHK